MTSSNNPSRSKDQDDPWEQLAEDLFGLEFGKEHAARETAPAGGEPAEEEPVSPAVTEPHSDAKPIPEKSASEPLMPVDAPPRYASAAIAESAPTFDESDTRAENERDESRQPVADSTPKPVSPQDSYWDALANWNWDESEGGSSRPRPEQRPSDQRRPEQRRSGGGPPSRGGSRGRDEGRGRRGGDRSERPSADAPPAGAPTTSSPEPSSRSPRQSIPAAGDDFGLGLESGTPGFSEPGDPSAVERGPHFGDHAEVPPSAGGAAQAGTESTAHRDATRSGQRPGERGPAAGTEGEMPRKRRRRRRRRGGRGGEGAAGPADAHPESSTAGPGSDWDDSTGPEKDMPDDESEPVGEQRDAGGSRDADTDQPASEGRGRGRHGHQDGPSGGAAVDRNEGVFDEEDDDESQEMILAGGGEGESDLDSDSDDGGGDGDDESGEGQTVSYENIPTWEEAISYLLHPNQVQVEPGASSGGTKPPRGAPSSDQPRQTRHVGHRKHRR